MIGRFRNLVFVAALGACSAALAQDASAPHGDAAVGKALFSAKGCFACHGDVGQGSREGPRLVPVTPYEAFVLQLRQPRAAMPPYQQAIVSDRQAADIYTYLADLPKPPDVKTIKLFQEN